MEELKESKENLPVSFLTDFISRGWDDVGYLNETIKSIGETFKGTKKVEELLQALADAYLVCIGQLEAYIQGKNYLDTEIENKLTEDININIDDYKIDVTNSNGETTTIPLNTEDQNDTDANKQIDDNVELDHVGDIPPAEIDLSVLGQDNQADTDDDTDDDIIIADDGEFNTPFEFDAPEVDNVKKFKKPEVADFFIDFDDPIGDPVSEKDLYGEEDEQLEREKIDDDLDIE